ncbi:DUF3027 domain-containing protein [Curtobacterium sp. MCBD17_003]|uniref:DUF3027 domain-containing protein n=1 Tax=Curtobacterium sp. MCBD17_003 TaxID=2175667 RepID=UPI000DA94C70|nr:DUF3027 domain-containing protein [Curtobacterium sp. MCBD17_003]WIE54247.1 DUF3027 domain-containing protein [Curtobacterium sp. MCBD17_003]
MIEDPTGLARTALLEVTPEDTVGAVVGTVDEGNGVVSVLFANTMPGYPGWRWTVSLAQVDGEDPTVLEVELMPGDGSLLAPDWVPWSERLAEYRATQEGDPDAEAGDAEDLGSDEDDSDDDPEDDDEDESDEDDDDADEDDEDLLDDDDDDDDDEDDSDEDDDLGDDAFDGVDVEEAIAVVEGDEDDEDSDEDDDDEPDGDGDDADGDDSDDDDSDDAGRTSAGHGEAADEAE